MASYIQGLTDYVPQIQQFTPDYNLLGNILQTKQGQYDAASKRLGEAYGSILYSPLSRQDNIEKRDAFFKAVEQDIKKMSGVDLSLPQNEQAGMKVFNGFYDDKLILKDMIWTKNYQGQMMKRDNLKACVDPDKCGGSAWEGGDKAMQYKLDEFRKADPNDAMNFQDVEYTPHINVEEKAVKFAKDMGFNMKYDTVAGGWIVTNKNGQIMAPHLADFFLHKFGNDPSVRQMYKTQAYVNRKDWVTSNIGTYGSEDAANLAYVSRMLAVNPYSKANENKTEEEARFSKNRQDLMEESVKKNGYYEEVDGPFKTIYQATKDSSEVLDTKKNIYKEGNDLANSAQNNFETVKISVDRLDEMVGLNLLRDATANAAVHYATLTSEQTYKEDPYALSTHNHNLALRNQLKTMEADLQNYAKKKEIDFGYDTKMEVLKSQLRKEEKSLSKGTVLGGTSLGQNGDQPLKEFENVRGAATDAGEINPKKDNFELLSSLNQNVESQKAGYLSDFIKEAINGYNNTDNDKQKLFYKEALQKSLEGTGVNIDGVLNGTTNVGEFMKQLSRVNSAQLKNSYQKARDYANPTGAGAAAKDFFSENFNATHAKNISEIQKSEELANEWNKEHDQMAGDSINQLSGDYKEKGDVKKAAMIESYTQFSKRPVDEEEITQPGVKEKILPTAIPYANKNWKLYLGQAKSMLNAKDYRDQNSSSANVRQPNILPKYANQDNNPDQFTDIEKKTAIALAREDYAKNIGSVLNDYDKYYKKGVISYRQADNLPGQSGNALAAKSFGGFADVANQSTATTTGVDFFKTYIDNLDNPNVKVSFLSPEYVPDMSSQDAKKAIDFMVSDMRVPHGEKDKNRPMFTWHAQDVSGNNSKFMSITVVPDPNYAEKLIGTKKNPGPLFDHQDEVVNGITITFPKEVVDNKYTSMMAKTPDDYLFQRKGYLEVNAQKDVKIRLDKVGNSHYITLKAKVVNQDGKVEEKKVTEEVYPSQYPGAEGSINAHAAIQAFENVALELQQGYNNDINQLRLKKGVKDPNVLTQ